MTVACVIVKDTLELPPELGTLPVPVQPVQTYCVPVPPATGEVTDAEMLAPLSNHPLAGVGVSYAEVDAK